MNSAERAASNEMPRFMQKVPRSFTVAVLLATVPCFDERYSGHSKAMR